MGFLDNSGDIILDAVLTDVGRNRLARGDGTFKIVKFALADDEVNYELYRNINHPNGAHPNGSAYYDLNILQTPVLEAFTNDTATMKSKLLRISRTDLLYLPVLQLNEIDEGVPSARNTSTTQAKDRFVIGVDEDTCRAYNDTVKPGFLESNPSNGFMNGVNGTGVVIRIDQGLDTADMSPKNPLDVSLTENRYLIQMDNRLGGLLPPSSKSTTPASPAGVNFVDDDNVAWYYFSKNSDSAFVVDNTNRDDIGTGSGQVISGPRGSTLKFKIKASVELQSSNTLFEKLGTKSATWTRKDGTTNTYHYIDSVIRIIGDTTGYSIDIPVRFAKKV